MRKTLGVIGLSFLVFSCAPQATTKKKPELPKKATDRTVTKTEAEPKKPNPQPEKPSVDHQGKYEFYRVNIADASKNDNTISHGSIVTAEPKGYTVTKAYFPSLGQNFRQRYLILHYTALDDDRSVRVLTTQSVSAHYLVGDQNDKEIYQLVDENKRAYHAGISSWRKIENLNDSSIGIEIVNPGYTTDSSGQRVFYPYPEWQFKKVAALVKDLVDRYQILPTNVLGHSDIAPTRKQDPGPLFPWERLYNEYGIGMWYDDATKQRFMNAPEAQNFEALLLDSTFIFKYQTYLNEFGYSLMRTGSTDQATQKTIEAFQYRFRPQNASGVMDLETWAILQALLEKYPAK